MIQRPKWRCSRMLWSMESMTRHKRSHGNPLHPGLAPDVLTLSCLWSQLGQDEKVRLTARLSLAIIQFTAHVILISNTHSQQAHICKSYKSPVAMGERRSSRWWNTGSCICDLHTGDLVNTQIIIHSVMTDEYQQSTISYSRQRNDRDSEEYEHYKT